MDAPLELAIDNEYTKERIEQFFGTSFGMRIKGITQRRSVADEPYILLFTREGGPYADRSEGDVFYYDGEGVDGDQKLTVANNGLIRSNDDKTPIFGFRQALNNVSWTYLGLLRVLDWAYVHDGERHKYEFKLSKTGFSSPAERDFAVKEIQVRSVSEPVLTESQKKQTISVKVRDRAFKDGVRKLYANTCAVCRKSRFSVAGYPEVEAAHIFPKEKDGSDDLRNGLALCKLHHWAFDAGLFSIADDCSILVRQGLDADSNYLEISIFSNKPLLGVADNAFSPHPIFLKEHRRIHGFE